MNIAPDVLLDQYQRGHRLWPVFADIETEYGLPPYLLFAVASRETGLAPKYAEGQVHADGHGWGLFGADDRWNTLDLPHFASDPEEQACLAARSLRANLKRLGTWLDAVNAYGPEWARGTDPDDYGPDVLARAEYLAEQLGETPLTPVQIIELVGQDLEAHGYEVWYADGWASRSTGTAPALNPQGLVCHHTATSRYAAGDYPSLALVRDGRSDLSGPLAQFGLGRSGRVYVIAAGKANHAGGGGWDGLSGNYTVWGIEAENDGDGEPWPAAQVDAYLALATALARHTGFGAEMVCRHAEWSDGGKIDTATAPMNDGDWIRTQVAARLVGDTAPPPLPEPVPEEDDMSTAASLNTLYNWGGGVFLLRPFGQPILLHSSENVIALLTAGATAIGDVDDTFHNNAGGTTIRVINVNDVATAAVRAAVVQPTEPLNCAEGDPQ